MSVWVGKAEEGVVKERTIEESDLAHKAARMRRERVNLQWDCDSLYLKLVCNLRGVRGTGKSDKEGYYTAALWLHQLHPKSLACNLESCEFGYRLDPDYKFLHDHVSDLFANCLKLDLESLKAGKLTDIQPCSQMNCQRGVYIGRNDWGSILTIEVASVAMKMYKDKFLKHDEGRFTEYLEKVKQGKAKIAAGALLPHRTNQSAIRHDDGWYSNGGVRGTRRPRFGVEHRAMERQADNIQQAPKASNSPGEDLISKVKFVRNIGRMNTDFQKVFDLILQVAVSGNLKEDEMIKKVFVFSDMEFSQASARPWETDYRTIVRKFKKNGYKNCVPEIVFWNLRDSRATPVVANQKGVALVSGFSKNLLTLFMEERGFHPEAIMEAAISGEEYQKLVVLD
ncbi:hypothetical protein HAX54_012466 [Datura stramonium]|uniref:Uncharacterized protein n=1 Tax=Datura stramonium TaxID=4076 RepID=A0ABS8TMM3_DATST|nr:hypothetical protein [Datura stramonium]